MNFGNDIRIITRSEYTLLRVYVQTLPIVLQMYTLGAQIISSLTDSQSYVSFVISRIFAPLGMTSSTFSPAEADATGRRSQAWSEGGRRIPHWETEEIKELSAGPGGITTNAEDMVRTQIFMLKLVLQPNG